MFPPIVQFLMMSRPAIFAPFDISVFQAHAYSGSEQMDELKGLITQIAKQYSVSPNWVYAMILAESSGNRYHIRYEPEFDHFYQPEVFAKNLHIPLSTEIEAQRFSWGLGQVMGAVAREQGHTGLMAELVEPSINIKHICIRINLLKKYSANPSDIFSMYNAGPGALAKKKKLGGVYPNPKYVDKVVAFLKTSAL